MVAEAVIDSSASIFASCATIKSDLHLGIKTLRSKAKDKLRSSKIKCLHSLRKVATLCCGTPAVHEHNSDVHSFKLYTSAPVMSHTEPTTPVVTLTEPVTFPLKIPRIKYGFKRGACRRTQFQYIQPSFTWATATQAQSILLVQKRFLWKPVF